MNPSLIQPLWRFLPIGAGSPASELQGTTISPLTMRWLLVGACFVLAILAMWVRRRVQRARQRIVEQTDQALARGREVLAEYHDYVEQCVKHGIAPLEPEELYRVHKAMKDLRELKKRYG